MSDVSLSPAQHRPLRLDDRVAVIVGAGQTPGATLGNGRATALVFAREGAKLVLVDRDAESVEETAGMVRDLGAEAVTVVADVAAEEGPAAIVDGALDAFGRIEVLHNNVGIGIGDGPAHRLDEDAFDRIVDVNLRAMWRTCKAAVPALRECGHGAIVNVSSLASVAAATHITAYKVSKAGVNALTHNLALSNAKHGLRANVILPGFIDTPMGVDAPARAYGMDRDDYAGLRDGLVPLGHQGEAWDVAHAALFLASDEARFITGAVLPVDGGQGAKVG